MKNPWTPVVPRGARVWIIRVSVACCLLMFAATNASAAGPADTPAERATLKGLHGARVVVDCAAGDAAPAGFQSQTLEAEIASRLRAADIPVLGAEERAQGQPTLCLTLMMFVDDSGEERMVSYWRQLSLVQETRLTRSPAVRVAAPTWHAPGSVGCAPVAELPKLRDAIRRDVDVFIAAYRAANAE